jgi:hypothetical protein
MFVHFTECRYTTLQTYGRKSTVLNVNRFFRRQGSTRPQKGLTKNCAIQLRNSRCELLAIQV